MTGDNVTGDPELPVEGTTDVSLSVEDMWDAFANVPGWPDWNPCMAWARITGGELVDFVELTGA